MKFRYLGKSGLPVSEISLGTMTFGALGWGCSEPEAHKIIARYLDSGGTLIDTADVYGNGESERIIGAFIRQIRRDEVLVASKSGFPVGASEYHYGSSRKHIIRSVEASLARLQTDYLDIYYLHRTDPFVPYEEIMETFSILFQQGKVLYAAFSNLPAWRIIAGNEAAKKRGMSGFLCGQYLYNLVDRSCEQEIIPATLNEGIGFLAWSPLAGGLLTGKYNDVQDVPAGSRFNLRKNLDIPRFWSERSRFLAKAVTELAEQHGTTASTLAIQWLLSRPFIASVIIGARTEEQILKNLAASDFQLSPELKQQMDILSEPEKNYLWGFNLETEKHFEARAKIPTWRYQ